jgi:hypothetical protein
MDGGFVFYMYEEGGMVCSKRREIGLGGEFRDEMQEKYK